MKRFSFLLQTLVYFSILFILFSCSTVSNKEVAQVTANDSIPQQLEYSVSFQQGIVIPKVVCAQLKKNKGKPDDSVTYALYLPKNYSPNKKYPVIFLFDAHGNGAFPIEKYKDLAEKYGYILVGSNDSKNGMNWDENQVLIKIFMNDVRDRFSIDGRRIYVCGFSGGSRVASSVAIFDGGINCVIGMGAGFPSLTDPIRNKFDYIGFAGNEDFNMNEMVALDSSMNRSPFRHQFIFFNGKHEWAPAEITEDAFFWMETNAMKDGLISKNDSLLKKISADASASLKNKNAFDQLLLCKKTINYLDGLADVSEFKKKEEELNKSEALKKELDKKNKIAKEEMSLQDSYRTNFVLKDLPWWTNEMKIINAKAKNKSDEENARMNKRMLSYLSLLAYMNCSNALQQKNFNSLERDLKIYEMAEPSNPEHQYMFADFYAMKNDNAKALSYLKNAVELGFNDAARMEVDPYFSSLKSFSEYSAIIAEMKNKKHD